MHLIWGRKWEMFPSWTVMRWNVLDALCHSFGSMSVSRLDDVSAGCCRGLVKVSSLSYSAHSSQLIKPYWQYSVMLSLRDYIAGRFWVWLLDSTCRRRFFQVLRFPPRPKTCSWDHLEPGNAWWPGLVCVLRCPVMCPFGDYEAVNRKWINRWNMMAL